MVESKENVNNVNTMVIDDVEAQAFQSATVSKRQKFLEEQAKDPVLASSSEEEDPKNGGAGEGSGSEESSSEEEIELEFPREDGQELLQFLHREVTNLSNLEDNTKRKFALIKLYQVFVLAKNKPANRVYNEVLPSIQKLLFKRFSDPVEKNRELACLIVKEFFSKVDDLSLSIPYLVPVLVNRLSAEDLEGIDDLPEQMRPQSNQKPLMMIDPPEKSEAVRVCLAEIVTIMVSATIYDCMRPYTQEIVNILRALCMDPAGQVIIEGCSGMKEFAVSGHEMLIHFCEVMGRALFTSFVHRHAKVRMAGLRALFDVMVCGKFKHSHLILSHMVGFRDPNIVPIKDFYETSTKLNYFACFVSDRSVVVRECFYRTIGDMLARLPDREDHMPALFPYLISGLYDANDSICSLVFEVLEELGLSHEETYEEKFRERKQLGFNEEWTLNGTIKECQKDLPFPIQHRPRLGARVLVRSYVRRYIKAIFHELGDWIEENTERTSNLLLFSIIYSEDFMVQFMDEMLVGMYKVVLSKTNKVLMRNLPASFRFLGRYCMPYTYEKLIIPAISNQLGSCFAHTQAGAIKGFGFMFKGAVELLPQSEDLKKVEQLLQSFMKAVKEHVADALDLELAEILVGTFDEIVSSLLDKQRAGISPSWLIRPYLTDIMLMSLKALATFQSFQLQGKHDPENVTASKKQIGQLLSKLTELAEPSEKSFFDANIAQVVADTFVNKRSEQLATISLQAPTWRMFFALFDHLTAEHLQQTLPEPESVFSRQARIRSQQQKDLKAAAIEEIKEDEEAGCTIEEVATPAIEQASESTEGAVAMANQEATGEEEVKEEEDKTKRVPKKVADAIPARQFLAIDEQESDDESERSKTVFYELCRVFLGILKNGDSSNIKTKQIALYKLFPRLVNMSLPFIQAEHSDQFMRILVRGCKIEWGTEKAKISHFLPHLKLTRDLVKSGGLVMSTTDTGIYGEKNFGRLLQTCQRCYLEVSERMKRDTLETMLLLLEQLNSQVISKVENGADLLDGTTFLHAVTHDLIAMLKDYFDSVRDASCRILEFLATNFMRKSPLMQEARSDLLNILQVSGNLGFSESMHTPTREAAEHEAEFVKYMFTDASDFLKGVITAMLDEPSTRESITRVILKMHEQLPFLLINDYRIACANNSLKRQEVIKAIMERAKSARA